MNHIPIVMSVLPVRNTLFVGLVMAALLIRPASGLSAEDYLVDE